MEIGIAVLTLVVGTVLSVWAAEHVKRPLVRLGGGGSSTVVAGCRIQTAAVYSPPGFIGIRFGRTQILGKVVDRGHVWGVEVERRPAECWATAVDADGGTFQLYFLNRDHTSASATVEIGGKDQAQFVIFGRTEDDYSSYFLYAPTSETDLTPRIISDSAKFKDTKRFTIQLQFAGARKADKAEVMVRRDPDGRLFYEFRQGKSSGGGHL